MHVMHELSYGGMELGVVKLVNALDRRFVSSTLCSCRPASSAKKRVASDVPVIELRRRTGNDPMLVPRLWKVFRTYKPEIVHTHAWGTLVEGWLAARLARVPVLVHGEHGTLQTQRRHVLAQRLIWSRADCLLSVSGQLTARMAREVGIEPSRIRTLRNGVDLRRFDPARRDSGRTALGLGEGDLAVGTVGRLVPVKDQATLVEAFARLAPHVPRSTLLIAGDGPLRDELTAQAVSLGVGDRMRLLGNRADIEDVLAAFDVFVLSSVSEGMSNTIQEAMATGLPVIATRVGSAEELVVHEQTGLLVPPSDASAMAEALEHLLHAPELRQAYGRAGREHATLTFALDQMLANYQRLYLDLAAQAGCL